MRIGTFALLLLAGCTFDYGELRGEARDGGGGDERVTADAHADPSDAARQQVPDPDAEAPEGLLCAPSDLRVTKVTSNAIDLAWSYPCSEEAGFVIERIVAGAFQNVGVVPPGVLAFTDGDLSPNTAYTYRVRAMKSGLFSEASRPVSVTTTN